MEIIGIIAEYNPFHKGHLYHINKIKEKYPDSLIIVILSNTITQRGELSIQNIYQKADLCLKNNIDLVIELPFYYAYESADFFAHGALKILNELNINILSFGSESNNLPLITTLASKQLEESFNNQLKEYLKQGYNYPKALSLSLNNKEIINTPNDLLGISYIKEIIKNNYPIKPFIIKRTNQYHNSDINNDIISASTIRELIKEKKDIQKYLPIPNIKYNYLDEDLIFKLLKHQIINHQKELTKYNFIDLPLQSKINKYLNNSDNLDELIKKIKSKDYTYNHIYRGLTSILLEYTKEEKASISDNPYLKIIGFNKKGKLYLNKIKKNIKLPIISKNTDYPMYNLEKRINQNYINITNDQDLLEKASLNKPIIY